MVDPFRECCRKPLLVNDSDFKSVSDPGRQECWYVEERGGRYMNGPETGDDCGSHRLVGKMQNESLCSVSTVYLNVYRLGSYIALDQVDFPLLITSSNNCPTDRTSRSSPSAAGTSSGEMGREGGQDVTTV